MTPRADAPGDAPESEAPSRVRGTGVRRPTRPTTDDDLVEPTVRTETDADRVSPERRRADTERERRVREVMGDDDGDLAEPTAKPETATRDDVEQYDDRRLIPRRERPDSVAQSPGPTGSDERDDERDDEQSARFRYKLQAGEPAPRTWSQERVSAEVRVMEAETSHDDALRRARATGSDPDRGGNGDPAAWTEYRAAYDELNDADIERSRLSRESDEPEDRAPQSEAPTQAATADPSSEGANAERGAPRDQVRMVNKTTGETIYVDPSDARVMDEVTAEGFTRSNPKPSRKPTATRPDDPSNPPNTAAGNLMLMDTKKSDLAQAITYDPKNGDLKVTYKDGRVVTFKNVWYERARKAGEDDRPDDLIEALEREQFQQISRPIGRLGDDGQGSRRQTGPRKKNRGGGRFHRMVDDSGDEILISVDDGDGYYDAQRDGYRDRGIVGGAEGGMAGGRQITGPRRAFGGGYPDRSGDGPSAGMGRSYDRFVGKHAGVVPTKRNEIDEVRRTLADVSGRPDGSPVTAAQAQVVASAMERLFSGEIRLDRGTPDTRDVSISVRISPRSVTTNRDGGLSVRIPIRLTSPDGNIDYGYAVNHVNVGRDGDVLGIEHGSIAIRKNYQGMGLASELNARNENIYRAIGAKNITLKGTSSSIPDSGNPNMPDMVLQTGATHWARNGFTWQDEESKQEFIGVIDRALRDRPGNFSAEERQRIGSLYRKGGDGKFETRATAEDLVDFESADRLFAEDGAVVRYRRDLAPSVLSENVSAGMASPTRTRSDSDGVREFLEDGDGAFMTPERARLQRDGAVGRRESAISERERLVNERDGVENGVVGSDLTDEQAQRRVDELNRQIADLDRRIDDLDRTAELFSEHARKLEAGIPIRGRRGGDAEAGDGTGISDAKRAQEITRQRTLVQRIRSGQTTVAELSAQLGIPESTIYSWMEAMA